MSPLLKVKPILLAVSFNIFVADCVLPRAVPVKTSGKVLTHYWVYRAESNLSLRSAYSSSINGVSRDFRKTTRTFTAFQTSATCDSISVSYTNVYNRFHNWRNSSLYGVDSGDDIFSEESGNATFTREGISRLVNPNDEDFFFYRFTSLFQSGDFIASNIFLPTLVVLPKDYLSTLSSDHFSDYRTDYESDSLGANYLSGSYSFVEVENCPINGQFGCVNYPHSEDYDWREDDGIPIDEPQSPDIEYGDQPLPYEYYLDSTYSTGIRWEYSDLSHPLNEEEHPVLHKDYGGYRPVTVFSGIKLLGNDFYGTVLFDNEFESDERFVLTGTPKYENGAFWCNNFYKNAYKVYKIIGSLPPYIFIDRLSRFSQPPVCIVLAFEATKEDSYDDYRFFFANDHFEDEWGFTRSAVSFGKALVDKSGLDPPNLKDINLNILKSKVVTDLDQDYDQLFFKAQWVSPACPWLSPRPQEPNSPNWFGSLWNSFISWLDFF